MLWCDRYPVAVAILAAAAISDWLDGWTARRLGQESATGALLDPVCDRVFAVTVLATLVRLRGLPVWQLGVLLGRDVVSTLGALAVWWRRPDATTRLRAQFSGKVVTSLQFWAAMHLALGLPAFGATLLAVAAASVWAIADYAVWFRELVGKADPTDVA